MSPRQAPQNAPSSWRRSALCCPPRAPAPAGPSAAPARRPRRRTVDYCGTFVKLLQARLTSRTPWDAAAMQPTMAAALDVSTPARALAPRCGRGSGPWAFHITGSCSCAAASRSRLSHDPSPSEPDQAAAAWTAPRPRPGRQRRARSRSPLRLAPRITLSSTLPHAHATPPFPSCCRLRATPSRPPAAWPASSCTPARTVSAARSTPSRGSPTAAAA